MCIAFKAVDFLKVKLCDTLCLYTPLQAACHFIIIFLISTMLIIWIYAWNISSTGKQSCELARTDRSHWPRSEVWLQHSYTTKVHRLQNICLSAVDLLKSHTRLHHCILLLPLQMEQESRFQNPAMVGHERQECGSVSNSKIVTWKDRTLYIYNKHIFIQIVLLWISQYLQWYLMKF